MCDAHEAFLAAVDHAGQARRARSSLPRRSREDA